MSKANISDNKKRPIGRPRVGSTLLGVRVPPADLAVLDAWIAKRAAGLSRPEAIRRLAWSEFKTKAAAR